MWLLTIVCIFNLYWIYIEQHWIILDALKCFMLEVLKFSLFSLEWNNKWLLNIYSVRFNILFDFYQMIIMIWYDHKAALVGKHCKAVCFRFKHTPLLFNVEFKNECIYLLLEKWNVKLSPVYSFPTHILMSLSLTLSLFKVRVFSLVESNESLLFVHRGLIHFLFCSFFFSFLSSLASRASFSTFPCDRFSTASFTEGELV